MTQTLIFPHLRINVTGMNEDHIAELETAKAQLWDGIRQRVWSEVFLCHQLHCQHSTASTELQHRIGKRLLDDGFISFQSAMYEVAEFQDWNKLEEPDQQKYKMLWIDQMIADIKEQLK